jgi:hypothetical protein
MLTQTNMPPSGLRRHKRLAVAGCLASVIAVGAMGLWIAERGPARAQSQSTEMDLALQATVSALLSNAACPKDPVLFQEAVATSFPFLHPELANREREKDPAYVQGQLVASNQITQAKEIAAELMKDESVRAQGEAALRAFQQGALSAWEAEDRVVKQAQLVHQLEKAALGLTNVVSGPTGGPGN